MSHDERMSNLREEWEAQNRHSLKVTAIGGGVGLLVTVALCWVSYVTGLWLIPEVAISVTVFGPILVLGGVVAAHEIDDRKKR